MKSTGSAPRLTNRQRREKGITKALGHGILRRAPKVIPDARKEFSRKACRMRYREED